MVGEVAVGVEGAEGRFIDECRGGEGARVDEWWVALVKRRDTEAVAVDVANDAIGGGVRGKKAGGFNRCGTAGSTVLGGGWSSRILRRHSMVRYAWGWSDDDDDEHDPDSSSMGGVIGRGAVGGDASRVGVRERDLGVDPRCPTRLRSGEALRRRFDGDSERLAARSVLAVLPEPRRLRNEKGDGLGDCLGDGLLGGPGPDACWCVTNDESRLYAGVDGSDGLSVSTGDDAEA